MEEAEVLFRKSRELVLGISRSGGGLCVRRIVPDEKEVLGKGRETQPGSGNLGDQFGTTTAIYCVPLGLQFIVVASQERSWFNLTFYSLGSFACS